MSRVRLHGRVRKQILRLFARTCRHLVVSQSRSVCIAVWGRVGELRGSVSHCAGGSKIREELEAQADDKVPDVSGHLRAGDEDAPDQNYQDRVECVAYVSQPAGDKKQKKRVFIKNELVSANDLQKLKVL